MNDDPDDKPLAPLFGTNVSLDSLSWMQGAGGISATMQDLARWARELYTGPMLASKPVSYTHLDVYKRQRQT